MLCANHHVEHSIQVAAYSLLRREPSFLDPREAVVIDVDQGIKGGRDGVDHVDPRGAPGRSYGQ